MIKKILLCAGFSISAFANHIVVLETNKGQIEVEIFDNRAPLAAKNFETLANKGFYNGLIFHRVIPNFMIQGGDPTGTGTGGESIYKEPFKDETYNGLDFQEPGMLAMANSGPNSNLSQFFITTVPTTWLNNKHTIFGKVIKGMEVVKEIESTETENTRPTSPQYIERMYLKKQEVVEDHTIENLTKQQEVKMKDIVNQNYIKEQMMKAINKNPSKQFNLNGLDSAGQE
jgi:peptidylprolyl isomerase